MNRPSKILALLVCCVVYRAAIGIYFASNDYYLSIANQFTMYATLLVALYREVVGRNTFLSDISSNLTVRKDIYLCLSLALALFLLQIGVAAIAALVYSHIDLRAAYDQFNFHENEINPAPFLSIKVITYTVTVCVAAPIAEEILFRKYLFESFLPRNKLALSTVLTAFSFAIFHFNSIHNVIGSFFFSIILSLVYIMRGRLFACILIHSLYNLTAFIHQYYFDTFWTRGINEISSMSDWYPQLTYLAVSLIILTAFCFHFYRWAARKDLTAPRIQH